MGLFDKLLKKEEKLETFADSAIITPVKGKLINVEEVKDPVFAQSMMGQSIAIEPAENYVVAPCNGTLEAVFPTGHAFGLRMEDGTGILVHIGIDTVSLNGEGFKVFKKQGDKVKAGEKVVSADFSLINKKGLEASTMLIITEPVEGKTYSFIEPQDVEKYQIINS